jgi:hypothetical protein
MDNDRESIERLAAELAKLEREFPADDRSESMDGYIQGLRARLESERWKQRTARP